MTTTGNSYLLDSTYAAFAKHYLSDNYPKSLLKMTIENSLDEFLIQVSKIADDSYESELEAHNHKNASPERKNTIHLSAKETANNVLSQEIDKRIKELIN